MPKKQHIKVVKVPLSREERPYDRPQAFPRMPRLYLELLENKAKIKQDLINKEYVPSSDALPVHNTPPNLEFIDNTRGSNLPDSPEKRKDRRRDIVKDDSDDSDDDDGKKDKDFTDRLDSLLKSNDSDSDSDSEDVKHKPSSKEEIKEENRDESSSDDDDLSVRLKQLLNDDSDEDSSVASFDKFKRSLGRGKKEDKYSRHRDENGHSHNQKRLGDDDPPTLAELEAQGGYTRKKDLRDINHITMNEQEEEDAKRELMFKFDLLKKSYPNALIPDFSIHSDYDSMKKTYDSSVRRLSLDSSVESYKTYLVGGFMACEFIFGNFLGFDMQGFTQQQILSMNSYEKLLIELGEKSYVPTGSKWPIELRLLFLIIMNAAFFIISKMIMKKTGANLMGMINGMNTSQVPSAAPVRKRRMRGPNIDLDDIPDSAPL